MTECVDHPAAESAGGGGSGPEVSVIVCTRNPREDLMRRVVEGLAGQTLERSRWELVLVDNGSSPAIEVGSVEEAMRTGYKPVPQARVAGGCGERFNVRVVREEMAGLTAARRKGIAEARAGLLVFVDDDNFLDADYLEQAVRIAREEPRVGHFGGIAKAEVEGGRVAEWKVPLMSHLGIRDHGDRVIVGEKSEWGPWEPIGAGMVSRRDVAERWAEVTRTDPNAAMLGRAGKALLSGEDGLFARVAYGLGYACAYRPELKLTHYMKRNRLSVKYLVRLFEGHGRSHVLLRRAMGDEPGDVTFGELFGRLRHRIAKKGWRRGVVTFFWDLGYRRQVRERVGGKGGSLVSA